MGGCWQPSPVATSITLPRSHAAQRCLSWMAGFVLAGVTRGYGDPGFPGCRCHVHVEGEGLGVGVVVLRVSF